MDIFQYTDYIAFLNDSLKELKEKNKNLSFRFLALKLQVSSAGYVSQIFSGKRGLPMDLAMRLADVFHLNRREKEYFQYVVQFCQARNHDEKKFFYEKMLFFKNSPFKTIDRDKYTLLEKWYYIAIREILAFYSFKGNFVELANMTDPPIRPAEAKEAIELLERLGFIKKDDKGYYRKVDDVLTTGNQPHSIAAQNYIISNLELAERALTEYNQQERSISSVTLSISEKEYQLIAEEIKAFRQRILKIATETKEINRVYQFNFQAFPVSKIK